MFELEIDRVFRAAHALVMYDGELEEMHAHDWHTVIAVAAEQLDEIDVVMDFHVLETEVDAILGVLEGKVLNDLPMFAEVNPSAERAAEWIGLSLMKKLPANVKLLGVTVTEATGCRAIFRPNGYRYS